MKKSGLTLLGLIFLLTLASGTVLAQNLERACVIVLKGQNQNRTVAGAINVECGGLDGVGLHDAPFGNWGVVFELRRVRRHGPVSRMVTSGRPRRRSCSGIPAQLE